MVVEKTEFTKIKRIGLFEWALANIDDIELTPRQLRIIYYRFLLANKLLEDVNYVPHETIIKSIVNQTLGIEDKTHLSGIEKDATDTVVTY